MTGFLLCVGLAICVILLGFLNRPVRQDLTISQTSEPRLSFPVDANIASAILPVADVIADAVESGRNEILVCPASEPKVATSVDWDSVLDQAGDFHVALVVELSDSTDGETKLMVELLSPASDPVAHINALSRIASDIPQSPLAALHLLAACAAAPSHPSCGDSLIDKVVDLDSDNGLTWAVIAGFELQRGNTASAGTALENAVNAPMYDDYSRRHLSLIKDHLPFVEGTDRVITFGRAVGIGVSVDLAGNNFQSLIDFCSAPAARDPGQADACLAFGRRAQKESSNLLNSHLGAALREVSLLALGETEAAAAVITELSIAREELIDADAQRAFHLLNHDDNLATNWFAELVANGEFAAVAYLVEEAKSLSADPAYNPCR